jgi:hypothetical protein
MSNKVAWLPSTDADIASYTVETAPASTGAWTTVGTVTHSLSNAAVYDAANGLFFLVHGAGTATSWYRITATDAMSQSTVGSPFTVGQTSGQLTTTDLDVVQMALGALGETTSIASLTSPVTKAEKLGVLFYSRTRDRLMARHNWSWATRRAELLLLTDHERTGWGYCYALPDDCLRVIDLDTGYRAVGKAVPTPWAIEMNDAGSGRILCCDLAPASLAYVARVTDPSLWSNSFTDALIFELASRLAMPMSIKSELASSLFQAATLSFSAALADDLNEQQPDSQPDSEIITARSW